MSNEETATKTITAYGQLERETKNQVRYATPWGVVYLPKTQVSKLTADGSFPENVKFTVEVQD